MPEAQPPLRRRSGKSELAQQVGEQIREQHRVRDERRQQRLDKLREAGYRGSGKPRAFSTHTPCGGVVYDPDTHDPLCPANDKGRTTPLLTEL